MSHDEDVALVRAFETNAEPIAWAADLPVITSARRDARAPKGFATYLTSLQAQITAPPAELPSSVNGQLELPVGGHENCP
ncbi:hypothetical protein [Mycolicibacterium chubuense]|uniref:Uncharacterized protein n=1 Tax=Mycolicibacterium chlorophenolicum TaxID=37916 RepID=A0A0J6VQV8_9MYCO|nr:hypothetical protein [Mycolicibacterium chubuense]KMO71863.1 hypothetical protein MCHLDSM_04235 [Mycolicibacterium chlorophenolicum]